MPAPILNGPVGQEEQAIAAILATFADDPLIGATGPMRASIFDSSGDRKFLPEVMDCPNEDELPAIRLKIGDYPSAWDTNQTHVGKLALEFELFAPGTHWADRFRLTNGFIAAIWPQDPTRRGVVDGRLDAAGVRSRRMAMGGTKTQALGSDQYLQITRAALVLTFDIAT